MFTEAESAKKLAYFALDMRRTGVQSAVLPSADHIVQACLDALPVGLHEVATIADPRDLRVLDRTQMLHSSQAKELVSAAQWHLDGVQDELLASQLRDWIDSSRASCSSRPHPRTGRSQCGGSVVGSHSGSG